MIRGVKSVGRAAGVALAACLCVLIEYQRESRALELQEQAGLKMLAAPASRLLNKAHQQNDDLSLYEVIGALNDAPGLVKVEVSRGDGDRQEKRGELGVLLRDGKARWGRLILTPSGHLKRKLGARHLAGNVLIFTGWSAALLLALEYASRVHRLSEKRDQEILGLLREEKECRQTAEARAERVTKEYSVALREAIASVDKPLILLDSRQRVAALSPSALARMGSPAMDSVLGKSWLEVPSLSLAGSEIERALATPGQQIVTDTALDTGRIIARAIVIDECSSWVEIRVE